MTTLVATYLEDGSILLGSDTCCSAAGMRHPASAEEKWVQLPCGCCALGLAGAHLPLILLRHRTWEEGAWTCRLDPWRFRAWLIDCLRHLDCLAEADTAAGTHNWPISGIYLQGGRRLFDFASDLDLGPVEPGRLAAHGSGREVALGAWWSLQRQERSGWGCLRGALDAACAWDTQTDYPIWVHEHGPEGRRLSRSWEALDGPCREAWPPPHLVEGP